nr:hypothetical protein [Methylomarinum sp. Ch1-1]MDP4523176.1 hypothetical protein [Methylomarinum sp. Ch1-1]
MGKNIINSPQGANCQVIERNIDEISDAHHAYLMSIIAAFTSAGLLIDKLDPHQFLWEQRNIIDKEMTSKDWRAVLPGDKIPVRMPDIDNAQETRDFAHLLYPSIGEQIFPRPAEDVAQNVTRIGNTWHSSILMSLPPQEPKAFNALFTKMLDSPDVPWRMSMLMEGDGMDSVVFRSILASIFHFTSLHNKRFNDAMVALRDFERTGSALVKLRCVFNTCVRNEANEDKALELLGRRSSELVAGIQSWGNCEATTMVGDPLLGFSATIPGLSLKSPVNRAPAPLSELVSMLPLTRPASPWRSGSVPLRTPDGKIMPYTHNSSMQASWIDLGVAPMGGGKSVFLNTYNFGFVFQGGLSRLPWLSIIDIGPSSSGLINLIKSSLPRDKQYLAAYHRLRMTSEFSINPFDLPVGCDKPLPSHMSFLVNLLSLLATPLDASAPQEGISSIARACIEAAYDELSREKTQDYMFLMLIQWLTERLVSLIS